MIAQIQMRRGTTAEWAAADPVVLAAGEPGWDSTLKRLKIGDGTTAWASLPWTDYGTNPNLLHNWDFRNLPVNQRNASGTISADGYFYDRWYRNMANIVISNSGYLTLATNAELVQPIEGPAIRGKTVTASVMLSNGTVISSSGVFADGSLTLTGFGTVVIQSVYLTYHSAVTFKADAARNVAAVKLELGTVSTLAYDPPMDYGMELLKCQRFYLQGLRARFPVGYVAGTTWYYRVNNLFPVRMRTTPTGILISCVLGFIGDVTAQASLTDFSPTELGGVDVADRTGSPTTLNHCSLLANFSADL